MSNINKEKIAILVKLQKIDIETGKIKSRLVNIPNQMSTLDQELEELTRSVQSEEETIDELNKKYRTYESDVQQNLTKIGKSQEKLRSVKTNKEYQSSLKEIEDIEKINSKLEDEMLEFLEQIDNAENILKERKEHFSEIVNQTNQEKEAINQDAEQSKHQLGRLEKDRNAISTDLDSSLLGIFERVKAKQTDSVGIVEVKDAVCQGCNLNIPPQMYNELHRCDNLKNCPNCQRIIYWEGNNERSE